LNTTASSSKLPAGVPPSLSARLYLRLAPEQSRLFRYLLEARDNLAYSSVTNRKACILKVVCSLQQRGALLQALAEIHAVIPFEFIAIRSLTDKDAAPPA
jgi:hypothetical protein